MNEKLIKDLCTYLGELDYIIENSKDYFERDQYEKKREAVHTLLELPYKIKGNDFMSFVRNIIKHEDIMRNSLNNVHENNSM